MSGTELASRLGLAAHQRDAEGRVTLRAPDGSAIYFYIDTRVVSVRGDPFTSADVLRIRAGEVWVNEDDAGTIESLWNTSILAESRDWFHRPLPLPDDGVRPATGPGSRPTPHPAPIGYTDPPTASEVRVWSVPKRGSQWKYIVIHHSATLTGSAAAFDADHKQRRDANGRPWDGLGYHFVIGNGTGSADGEVEVGYRWRGQKRGAHAGTDVMNVQGIGICLVGDFTKTRPSPAQMRALSRLCNFLSSYCDIARSGFRLHGDVKQTACPGPNFPRDFLYATRSSNLSSIRSDGDRGTR